ncbi:MAG: polysaccharide deacetylase family protein [Clostridia bacterium]|nr:polysaccharide deacetylase family protein [Clostridia bacterium]
MKKSRLIIILLLIAVLSIATSLCFNPRITSAFSSQKKLPIYSVECKEQKVALSFDAAWGADKTRQIMELLERYKMNATFFLVGFWIDKYPELTKEIDERGFLVGNHSTNHLHMSGLSQEEVRRELETTNKKIKDITGKDAVFFRAPFGEYNKTLLTCTEEMKMFCIQWDVDSLDWKGLSGAQIAERVLSRAKAGSIILCHNNSDHILDALPIILTGLKNKGFTSVRMNELVLQQNYYIDKNGRQFAK